MLSTARSSGSSEVSRKRGKRYRVLCGGCQAKLDVNPEFGRLIGYVLPGGDALTLVCDEKCERKLYQHARIVNYLLSGDPVAMHSDSVIRLDLVLKYGGAVTIKDGKVFYPDAPEE